MRLPVLAILLLAPTLAACASPRAATGNAVPTSAEEMARLESQCRARNGVLVPSGRLTSQPSLDYICRVSPAEPRER